MASHHGAEAMALFTATFRSTLVRVQHRYPCHGLPTTSGCSPHKLLSFKNQKNIVLKTFRRTKKSGKAFRGLVFYHSSSSHSSSSQSSSSHSSSSSNTIISPPTRVWVYGEPLKNILKIFVRQKSRMLLQEWVGVFKVLPQNFCRKSSFWLRHFRR